MRKFVQFSYVAAIAGLLLVSIQSRAANSPKYNAEDPVRICQSGCKVHQDNLAYENCMLKCRADHKTDKPVFPTPPTKKK